MEYIKPDLVKVARSMDLLTYMQSYEPYDLVHIKGDVYSLKSHDSLKISNGKWMWWSKGIGGRSALDYLIKVKDMDFKEAVSHILSGYKMLPDVSEISEPVKEQKPLLIPPRESYDRPAYEYLCQMRGLDREIVKYFLIRGDIYLTKQHHNIAFVGRDYEGNIKLISQRGIRGDFKNTTSGSDRRYVFKSDANEQRNLIHVFEAPIDLLSYATLLKLQGDDYKRANMLALCGVASMREDKLPIALDEYLKQRPYTKGVCLHLDNDEAGHKAAMQMQKVLENRGLKVIIDFPPEQFKDCNECLMAVRMSEKQKTNQMER